jgi:hypothetical protein
MNGESDENSGTGMKAHQCCERNRDTKQMVWRARILCYNRCKGMINYENLKEMIDNKEQTTCFLILNSEYFEITIRSSGLLPILTARIIKRVRVSQENSRMTKENGTS